MSEDSVKYIVTSMHYAQQMGCPSSLSRILKMRDEINRKKRIVLEMQPDKYAADPVFGFIESGQWIARCECGGCEFVDPDDGVFYCFSCCNRRYNYMMRHVVFPDYGTRQEIERLLLLRPVDDIRGQNDLERAALARAVIGVQIFEQKKIVPLARSWNAGDSLELLHAQQDQAILAWEAVGRPKPGRDSMFVFTISLQDGEA